MTELEKAEQFQWKLITSSVKESLQNDEATPSAIVFLKSEYARNVITYRGFNYNSIIKFLEYSWETVEDNTNENKQ